MDAILAPPATGAALDRAAIVDGPLLAFAPADMARPPSLLGVFLALLDPEAEAEDAACAAGIVVGSL